MLMTRGPLAILMVLGLRQHNTSWQEYVAMGASSLHVLEKREREDIAIRNKQSNIAMKDLPQ